MDSAVTKADIELLQSSIGQLVGSLETRLEAKFQTLEINYNSIKSRLEDIERTNHIVNNAPRTPEDERRTHRAVRANSVSGPRYR